MEYFVIDPEGHTSWSDDDDGPERFKTMLAALRRAKKLARLTPGKVFLVAEARQGVVSPIAPTEIIEL